MALNKNDLLLLLTELQNKGVEVKPQINTLLRSTTIPLDVLKFVNNQKPLEVIQFYDHVRKNGNEKKSNLYKNIVKEIEEPQEILTTLSAMLTQILLWNRNVANKNLFLEHTRAKEISLVLAEYCKSYNIIPAMDLIKLIKADIIALEYVSGHRV